MLLMVCMPGACAMGGGHWDSVNGRDSGGRAKAAREPMMLPVARWRGAHGFSGLGRAFAGGLSLRRKKMIEDRVASCPQRLSLPQEHLLMPRSTFPLPTWRLLMLMLDTWRCLYYCATHAVMAPEYPTAHWKMFVAWSSNKGLPAYHVRLCSPTFLPPPLPNMHVPLFMSQELRMIPSSVLGLHLVLRALPCVSGTHCTAREIWGDVRRDAGEVERKWHFHWTGCRRVFKGRGGVRCTLFCLARTSRTQHSCGSRTEYVKAATSKSWSTRDLRDFLANQRLWEFTGGKLIREVSRRRPGDRRLLSTFRMGAANFRGDHGGWSDFIYWRHISSISVELVFMRGQDRRGKKGCRTFTSVDMTRFKLASFRFHLRETTSGDTVMFCEIAAEFDARFFTSGFFSSFFDFSPGDCRWRKEADEPGIYGVDLDAAPGGGGRGALRPLRFDPLLCDAYSWCGACHGEARWAHVQARSSG